MFRRLRQVAARDGRNPRMNRHLNEVDNGHHAREERRRSVARGAIKTVHPEHFLSEEAVGRRFTAGVSRRRGKASERLEPRAHPVSLATTRLFMFKKRILEDDEDGKPRKKQASWIEDDVDDVNKTCE